MSERLLVETEALLAKAIERYDGHPVADDLRKAQTRLSEPLRVAIAGKVKAGKSTLLNALVGERLAPTDASECTKIVTWYQDGVSYQVLAHPSEQAPRQLRFDRSDGALDVQLDDLTPADIDRLVIDWPSSSLRQMTLIDTPGIVSVSTEVSDRTHRFLTPDDEHPTEADAVVYLMRHLHSSDHEFLESFHDEDVSQATPVNAIAVLSRADEIGVGRLDAMTSARRIAARYRSEPQVRRLCQTVIPVAGLLAETAATMRQDEFVALQTLAERDREIVDRLLLSAERFMTSEADVGVTPMVREHLALRFGLFGVRTAVALVRQGAVTTCPELAAELSRRSGIQALRDALTQQFENRRAVLKARAALVALETVLGQYPDEELAVDLERVLAGAHEFAELRLMNAIRSGQVDFGESTPEAEQILGANGGELRSRLGLRPAADDTEVKSAAVELISTWQRRGENPLATKSTADAARVIVRSLEGLLAAV